MSIYGSLAAFRGFDINCEDGHRFLGMDLPPKPRRDPILPRLLGAGPRRMPSGYTGARGVGRLSVPWYKHAHTQTNNS